MTRSLIKSVNGHWDHLPMVCKCGHTFTLELADEVQVKVAQKGLAHEWFGRCSKCKSAVPIIVRPSAIQTTRTDAVNNR